MNPRNKQDQVQCINMYCKLVRLTNLIFSICHVEYEKTEKIKFHIN
jgi:hypothetical protein